MITPYTPLNQKPAAVLAAKKIQSIKFEYEALGPTSFDLMCLYTFEDVWIIKCNHQT